MRSQRITLAVNGHRHRLAVAPDLPLIDLLREKLRLTGTKRGCGIGVCGSCTVLVDGRPARACRTPAVAVAGAAILTIEGLQSPAGQLHPLQQAFIDAGAVQCGFCTPGMILAAKALLDRHPQPARTEIRRALRGNLCRCTGYQQIVDAVELAAARMAAGSGQPYDASPQNARQSSGELMLPPARGSSTSTRKVRSARRR